MLSLSLFFSFTLKLTLVLLPLSASLSVSPLVSSLFVHFTFFFTLYFLPPPYSPLFYFFLPNYLHHPPAMFHFWFLFPFFLISFFWLHLISSLPLFPSTNISLTDLFSSPTSVCITNRATSFSPLLLFNPSLLLHQSVTLFSPSLLIYFPCIFLSFLFFFLTSSNGRYLEALIVVRCFPTSHISLTHERNLWGRRLEMQLCTGRCADAHTHSHTHITKHIIMYAERH